MKPSIPKGTRDFSPVEMQRRNYIFNSIKSIYQRYGYLPIETPAMENLSTLLGKYGEEGDKLLFKILNSGDFLNGISFDDLKMIADHYKEKGMTASSNSLVKEIENITSGKFSMLISEKGLRYDLTVPFARYVVMHQNDITFPFKRYQIQPVWRADRPQKGRYREFYQCDADVIGSNSLLNEIELCLIIDDVFTTLNLPVSIKINNRKILSGLAEVLNASDKIIDITVAIDKLDKIGLDKVIEELQQKNLSAEAIEKLKPLLTFSGDLGAKLTFLKSYLTTSEIGLKGIEEIEFIFDRIAKLGLKTAQIELDLTLARGLNYYTGAIFEVKAINAEMGSICGGGRYDDLTGIFGLNNMSGVGISFGIDRIYDVLLDKGLFDIPTDFDNTKVLIVNFGEKEADFGLGIVRKLREAGINAELYPDAAKMKKQMTYADDRKIPYVILLGEEEINSGQLAFKNMLTGIQEIRTIENIIEELKNK
ncbi:MAG: histidine--tRNA ligase [Bacteroidota bacterium]